MKKDFVRWAAVAACCVATLQGQGQVRTETTAEAVAETTETAKTESVTAAKIESATAEAKTVGLKDAYAGAWRMGVSLNQWEVEDELRRGGTSSSPHAGHFALAERHFGWVVAENCMKSEAVHPRESVYDFTAADQMVDLARARGMQVVGHCLVWHSQCPRWFFVDDEGRQVSAEVLRKRLREHIYTVVSHFRGRVVGWDVVNEAFNDDGTLRRSKFYEILGEEYIALAFQYAHEADPEAELYYNDYSMNLPRKCDGVVNFFRPLMEQGLPIHAIGMQGHMVLGEADYVAQYDRSIRTIREAGLMTQFTELDLSVLPSPWGFSGADVAWRSGEASGNNGTNATSGGTNGGASSGGTNDGASSDGTNTSGGGTSAGAGNRAGTDNGAETEAARLRRLLNPYPTALPDSVQQKADSLWLALFRMMLTHKESILRTCFWCLTDGNSWRNGFPLHGRTDYATLFDRQNRPKPTVQKLIDLAQELLPSTPSKKSPNSSSDTNKSVYLQTETKQ